MSWLCGFSRICVCLLSLLLLLLLLLVFFYGFATQSVFSILKGRYVCPEIITWTNMTSLRNWPHVKALENLSCQTLHTHPNHISNEAGWTKRVPVFICETLHVNLESMFFFVEGRGMGGGISGQAAITILIVDLLTNICYCLYNIVLNSYAKHVVFRTQAILDKQKGCRKPNGGWIVLNISIT